MINFVSCFPIPLVACEDVDDVVVVADVPGIAADCHSFVAFVVPADYEDRYFLFALFWCESAFVGSSFPSLVQVDQASVRVEAFWLSFFDFDWFARFLCKNRSAFPARCKRCVVEAWNALSTLPTRILVEEKQPHLAPGWKKPHKRKYYVWKELRIIALSWGHTEGLHKIAERLYSERDWHGRDRPVTIHKPYITIDELRTVQRATKISKHELEASIVSVRNDSSKLADV